VIYSRSSRQITRTDAGSKKTVRTSFDKPFVRGGLDPDRRVKCRSWRVGEGKMGDMRIGNLEMGMDEEGMVIVRISFRGFVLASGGWVGWV
jgi:hypothetical protein